MTRTAILAPSWIDRTIATSQRGGRHRRASAADALDTVVAHRAFAQTAMSRSPEAFASEYDLLTLMLQYPGHFSPGE